MLKSLIGADIGKISRFQFRQNLSIAFCNCLSAYCTALFWLANRRLIKNKFFSEGYFLAIALKCMLDRMGGSVEPVPSSFYEQGANELVRLHEQNRLLSILPVGLCPENQSPPTFASIP